MTLAISEKMPSPGILLEEPWNLNKEEALTVIRVLLDTLRLSAAVSFRSGFHLKMSTSILEIIQGISALINLHH